MPQKVYNKIKDKGVYMNYYINEVKTSRLAFARSIKFVSGFSTRETIECLLVLENCIGIAYKDNGYTFKCVA